MHFETVAQAFLRSIGAEKVSRAILSKINWYFHPPF